MKLTTKDGRLYAEDKLLLCVYPAGDCDTIPWPNLFDEGDYWNEEKWTQALTGALYDAREMGYVPDVHEVELPDGTKFTF